ncbi:MAG: phosphonate ABC transporter ATP-binding protein [Alphaproteobacteria bacterium]|jgi:phosphonate transport system ATP-binding protein|nr:phosphonate ABC transporter ATP-binding protein [Alphaproteobacteria bacterium]
MDAEPAPRAGTAAAGADLAVAGVAKRFAATQVLEGVDFTVPAGQAVALIGANGAGKSTLLRCCLRLIEPDAGTIRLLGRDVRALDAGGLRALRAEVGFVFQKHNLVGRLSALSNVLHGALGRAAFGRAWFQSLAPQDLRAEAMQCLERVGLADIATRRADRLSGGQSQRVAIARALMQRPRLMFADEPVASLDPAAGEEVMALFLDLIRRQGLTLLFTSHDLAHAIAFADRVIALRAGRIVLDAPADTLEVAQLRALYD